MVKHVLKDGTVLHDISGHKVTREQAPIVYKVLEQVRKEKQHEQKRTEQNI